ncbi:MAG: NAD(P)H-hydrate dehydratase [Prevotellaceae bacterium]|nr:NAD(P)H-hydrate dehydratase [Prevotellaceae bacterium]
MKIFTNTQVRDLDAYTIEHEPIASIDLMERAAHAIVSYLCARYLPNVPFVVFAGPGNNGGDALAVARLLLEAGYDTKAYLFAPHDKLSPDCRTNMQRLQQASSDCLTVSMNPASFTVPELTDVPIIIDGLFGSGLNRPISGDYALIVRYMNRCDAQVISIDIPSGLMAEDNRSNTPETIVRANMTLTLQSPKLAFFLAENADYVGDWQILPIGISEEAIRLTKTPYSYIKGIEDLQIKWRVRPKFAHKGMFGHALLIAGSQGMAGASILAARACLRSGIGLLSVRAPLNNLPILQATVPEAMVLSDPNAQVFSTAVDVERYQAIAIGPGLGQAASTSKAVEAQLAICRRPMVIDADALNILASTATLSSVPANSILTPHLKELERLIGTCGSDYERLLRASDCAQKYHLYIVLKGAHTAILSPDGTISFNSTGNPGMATGGSGDVLTGILLALLAQGYTPKEAVRMGVFVHGLAGDIATKRIGLPQLIAGDIIESLPAAWQQLYAEYSTYSHY